MRDPNEALVFLARRESRQFGFHERFKFVSELYAAGASHVAIGVDDDMRFPSNGVTVHLPTAHAAVDAVEGVLAARASLLSDIRQRGNTVRVFWRGAAPGRA